MKDYVNCSCGISAKTIESRVIERGGMIFRERRKVCGYGPKPENRKCKFSMTTQEIDKQLLKWADLPDLLSEMNVNERIKNIRNP
jgi:hypothetical protein